jgi:hypothetical protein
VFTNTSAQPCTLRGYPTVAFLTGASGRQVNVDFGHATSPTDAASPVAVATVPLAPGGRARADVLYPQLANLSADTCRPVDVAGLRISLPDDSTTTYLAAPGKACSAGGVGVPMVYPIQKG